MLVRPHDFTVSRVAASGGIPATVARVLTAGAVVKLELFDRREQALYVHLSHAEYAADPVAVSERVYLVPRSSRIFRNGEDWNGDYVI